MQNDHFEKLGWKTFGVFVSERSQIALVIGVIAIGCALFSNVPQISMIFGYVLFVFFVSLVVTIFVSWLQYIRYQFSLSDDSLKIHRGVFTQEQLSIPYRQIQNIDIERDFVYQLTGMSKLVILTAGHDDADEDKAHSEGVIPIIDKNLAIRLQNELSSRANIQKVTNV